MNHSSATDERDVDDLSALDEYRDPKERRGTGPTRERVLSFRKLLQRPTQRVGSTHCGESEDKSSSASSLMLNFG